MLKFQCDFGPCICTVEAVEAKPGKSTSNAISARWNCPPPDYLTEPYILWMHTVMQEVVDHWGQYTKSHYALPGGGYRSFGYLPGEKQPVEIAVNVPLIEAAEEYLNSHDGASTVVLKNHQPPQ